MKFDVARGALAFATTRAPQPGDVFGGVTLGDEIGRGGMARVFRAHHERLGVDVAVKVLLEQNGNPEVAERFAVEAHALAKLDSPHIVRVLDFGLTDDGAPFVVTELLGGQSLAERLLAGPMPPADVVELVSQVAGALEAAHGAGVIHRDVKPSNLHLVEKGRVKLLDFGAAKSEAPLKTATTSTGLVIGTPLYMSPEQLTSPRRVDTRADVWSLAVVAFELLTGRRPFEAETVGELAIAQTKGLARNASSYDPALRSFDAVFARAFHPDLTKRHATPRELRDELEGASKNRLREQPGRKVFALALALGVGLASSVAWAMRREASEPTPSPAREALTEVAPAPTAPEQPSSTTPTPVSTVIISRPPTRDPRGAPINTATSRAPERTSTPASPPPAVSARKDRGF